MKKQWLLPKTLYNTVSFVKLSKNTPFEKVNQNTVLCAAFSILIIISDNELTGFTMFAFSFILSFFKVLHFA